MSLGEQWEVAGLAHTVCSFPASPGLFSALDGLAHDCHCGVETPGQLTSVGVPWTATIPTVFLGSSVPI